MPAIAAAAAEELWRFLDLQVSGKELAQRAAAAGAAVLLSAGMAAPALATEFDILAEPTPTKAYYVDDASVLSKATRSELNKKLGILEVRRPDNEQHRLAPQQLTGFDGASAALACACIYISCSSKASLFCATIATNALSCRARQL